MSINEALAPCPFCSSQPEIEEVGNDRTPKRKITVKCPKCRVQQTNGAIRFDMAWLRKVAIESWNARSQAPAPALPVEAIQAAIMLMQAENYHDSMSNPFPEYVEENNNRIGVRARHIDSLRALLPPPPQAEEKSNG